MDSNIKDFIDVEDAHKDLFLAKIDSKLTMNVRKNQIVDNDEWIDMVNFTIPYLEKALNKFNKQIVTEEEVIKIELIKKVTVESIKHLSKNTNFISEFDEETGDVIPSKILNAYKEESFLTYENRFLYTLIKLIDDFIFLRTREEEETDDEKLKKYKGKNYQQAKYEGTTKINKEKIKLNFEYISENTDGEKRERDNEEKINELRKGMSMIKATELFKILDSTRITLVKPPLKMTNVLLKNVNFQYCVKLWDYLNSHLDAQTKSIKESKEFEDKGLTKELIDQDFFIKYLIFNGLNFQVTNSKKLKTSALDEKQKKELTDLLIQKLINLNPNLSDLELKKLIAEKYIAYRTKKYISLKPLEDEFNNKIKDYLEKIEKLRIK